MIALMLKHSDIEPEQGRDTAGELASYRARLAKRMFGELPEAGDHDSPVPGLSFYRRDAYVEPVSVVYEPSLCLAIQGRKNVVLGTETFEYDEDRFLLPSVELPTIAQALDGTRARPFLSLILKLDIALVRELCGEIDAHGLHDGATGPGLAVAPVTTGLFDAVVRLAALADTPQDIAIMGRMVMREIIYHLLVGPAGGQLRQIAVQGTKCNRVARVIAWLRENFAEPVRIETLAEMAAMGVSTLHHHFRAITRMSPLQYQKQIRLHEARRLLLTEQMDASSAAFRVGYESVTQFNREYKRLFGNPPLRDIAVLRGRRDAPPPALMVVR
jgi:AraC-like DNA-binding protein